MMFLSVKDMCVLCTGLIVAATIIGLGSPPFMATAVTVIKQEPCGEYHDISPVVASVLCAVESGDWYISKSNPAMLNAGCLIGQEARCQAPMEVPTQAQIPKSPPPPEAKNKQYQELATKAELVVPQTWWREGFASDLLLLSHNDSELPRKQFNAKILSNKKLKNIIQCVTRQQFIRKTFDASGPEPGATKMEQGNPVFRATGDQGCAAFEQPVVQSFYKLWMADKDLVGGEYIRSVSTPIGSGGHAFWHAKNDDRKILMSALEVLEYFYTNHGGIWTGCFRFDSSPKCRGALAAATYVSALHALSDIAGTKKATITESHLVRGYLLASVGRSVLHGDTSTTAGGSSKSRSDGSVTEWKVKLDDFIALQQAFLQVYVKSFGAVYTRQLDKYVPFAFPPNFKVHAKKKWGHHAHELETVYTSLRNWMFHEAGNLIDFGPYIPLVAFKDVRDSVMANNKRRVLVDVGANGFYASPKYLLDSYAPYLPFTHAVMVEPEPHFSASIPAVYSERYNISFLQIYAEVATGSQTDMLRLLPTLVTKDDFVVLKFDVDPNRYVL